MNDSRPPAMDVAEIEKAYKGKLHVTTLVRRTFRDGKKVRHETISNISGLPPDLTESIKLRFKSGLPLVGADEQFIIERSLPHGNVAAVLGTMKKLGMEKLLAHRPCRERQLVLAMIADRILSPGSKLSCSDGLCAATVQNDRCRPASSEFPVGAGRPGNVMSSRCPLQPYRQSAHAADGVDHSAASLPRTAERHRLTLTRKAGSCRRCSASLPSGSSHSLRPAPPIPAVVSPVTSPRDWARCSDAGVAHADLQRS